jgi:hypothetical protein
MMPDLVLKSEWVYVCFDFRCGCVVVAAATVMAPASKSESPPDR